jgi:hypothetical protein
MKTDSAQASCREPRARERIDMNESRALARNTSASTASSLSIISWMCPCGPRWPIDSTVMHTPIIVADVGRMWAERPLAPRLASARCCPRFAGSSLLMVAGGAVGGPARVA